MFKDRRFQIPNAGDKTETAVVELFSGFVIEDRQFIGCDVVVLVLIRVELFMKTGISEVLDDGLLVVVLRKHEAFKFIAFKAGSVASHFEML